MRVIDLIVDWIVCSIVILIKCNVIECIVIVAIILIRLIDCIVIVAAIQIRLPL